MEMNWPGAFVCITMLLVLGKLLLELIKRGKL